MNNRFFFFFFENKISLWLKHKLIEELDPSQSMWHWISTQRTDVTPLQPLDNTLFMIDMRARHASHFQTSLKLLRAYDTCCNRVQLILLKGNLLQCFNGWFGCRNKFPLMIPHDRIDHLIIIIISIGLIERIDHLIIHRTHRTLRQLIWVMCQPIEQPLISLVIHILVFQLGHSCP